MDRADAAGFGIAAAGHVALLAALSVGFAVSKMPEIRSTPIEVAFVDEVGLESTSPTPTQEMPAPLAGPVDEPLEPAVPEAAIAQPVPPPSAVAPSRPQPRVEPRLAPRPAPVPPKQVPRRTAGGLDNVVAGLSDRETDSRSTEPPAAAAGPQVQASLVAEVRRRVKPHWKAPTGADAEQLRTEVLISLDRSGRVTDVEILSTSGQTASNRPQVPLHREQAVRAVRLGAPFPLPAQFYDAWKQIKITFDKRLSQ
jgi:outer membrane biosynthesis protein TonB